MVSGAANLAIVERINAVLEKREIAAVPAMAPDPT